MTVNKRCGKCGATHTTESWATLPLVGINNMGTDDEPEWLCWRNCTCGSTLVVEVA